MTERDPLPEEAPPRGLRKPQAAFYVGLSVDKFEQHVRAGTFPGALPLGKPHVWDRQALDRAMDRLSRSRSSEPRRTGEDLALEALRERQDALRHRKTQHSQP